MKFEKRKISIKSKWKVYFSSISIHDVNNGIGSYQQRYGIKAVQETNAALLLASISKRNKEENLKSLLIQI